MSNHQRPKINAIESDPELLIEKDIRVVCTPMETVYEALFKASMLDEEREKKEEKKDREGQYCLYHKGPVGHSIQDCQHFLELVQEMMDEGVMEFCKETEKRTSYECPTRTNFKTDNHLLLRRRPTSSRKNTYLPHP